MFKFGLIPWLIKGVNLFAYCKCCSLLLPGFTCYLSCRKTYFGDLYTGGNGGVFSVKRLIEHMAIVILFVILLADHRLGFHPF